jgi:chemotaxis-related protein WspD
MPGNNHSIDDRTQFRHGRSLFDRDIPDGVRQEWTRELATGKEMEEGDVVSVLVFRLAPEWLALRTNCFQEALDRRPVRTVPFRSNNVMRGLVNVNGELLPVVSVADLVRLQPEEEEPEESLLALAWNGQRFVIPVQRVVGVFRLPRSAMRKLPATISQSPEALTEALFELGERRVGLLNEDRLFEALGRQLHPSGAARTAEHYHLAQGPGEGLLNLEDL